LKGDPYIYHRHGGFIGVDIFFVISGYLISTIIFGSLERNNFSFTEFYIRRIKRIFPALLLVLLACFAFGWITLTSGEYKQLGKQIAGGAGFISNMLFLKESGYFDNAAEMKPLLHLWSLGVEEQFYILWPVLLWFAWKTRLNLLLIAIIVGLISFGLNIYQVKIDSTTAFYSPQTRFWELMIGSVLAYITQHKQSLFNIKLQRDFLS
jgi:peptidoglycan/LPS O-acetylase OafA/YrhL